MDLGHLCPAALADPSVDGLPVLLLPGLRGRLGALIEDAGHIVPDQRLPDLDGVVPVPEMELRQRGQIQGDGLRFVRRRCRRGVFRRDESPDVSPVDLDLPLDDLPGVSAVALDDVDIAARDGADITDVIRDSGVVSLAGVVPVVEDQVERDCRIRL